MNSGWNLPPLRFSSRPTIVDQAARKRLIPRGPSEAIEPRPGASGAISQFRSAAVPLANHPCNPEPIADLEATSTIPDNEL